MSYLSIDMARRYLRRINRLRRPVRRPVVSNMKRRYRVARGRIAGRQPVQYFKRSKFTVGSLTVPVATTNLQGVAFTLADLPDYGDFTALYDQYKILGIKVKWLPRGNSSDIQAQNSISRFFSVIDRDDDATPTSIDQLTQYESCKMTPTTGVHSRYFKPSIRREIPNAIGGTAHEVTGPQWIDVTNANVKHYGIKLAVQGPLSGTGSIYFDAQVTMYLAFKNVR